MPSEDRGLGGNDGDAGQFIPDSAGASARNERSLLPVTA